MLAVENLHWSDPTSEEWLASLVERLGEMPVLLLATYRPGYQPPWLRHAVATQVALPRLSPRDSLAVVQAVPQAAQLPGPLSNRRLLAKAAGNPFFVEELAWVAVESGDHARPLPLPETIQAVLAARLDRLPRRPNAWCRSRPSLAPRCPCRCCRRLPTGPRRPCSEALAQLQAAEFLYEIRLFPDQVYAFKHALTHEVAYGSLLQERRRALHAQIVAVLETLAGDGQPAQVDRLAQHALRGEVWDKAFRYCWQVGATALAGSAYREAVAHLEPALEALAHLPADRTTHGAGHRSALRPVPRVAAARPI